MGNDGGADTSGHQADTSVHRADTEGSATFGGSNRRLLRVRATCHAHGTLSGYRPISKLGVSDPDLDTLHEEVIPWMVAPLLNWLEGFLWVREPHKNRVTNVDFVDALEMALRLRKPFNRKYNTLPARDVEDRIRAGGMFGIDVASYAVYDATASDANYLQWVVEESGSAGEVTPTPVEGKSRKKVYLLTRRHLAAAKLAITEVGPVRERAGQHLASAWKRSPLGTLTPTGATIKR